MENRRLLYTRATANPRPAASLWAVFRKRAFQWTAIGRPTCAAVDLSSEAGWRLRVLFQVLP